MRLLKRRDDHQREAIASLYGEAVATARQPKFYTQLGVPDTVDGRYELIVLHVFLLVRTLRRNAQKGGELAQMLFDLMFADMDQSLREMGAGDLGVGRKVQRMAKGFYGRAQAYEAALAADDGAMREALSRNLFGTVDARSSDLDAMAKYLRTAAESVDQAPWTELSDGSFRFDRM